MGLAEVLSRRDRAGESCRQPNGRQDAVLGGDGASVRLRLRGRGVSESTSGIWMDERNFARHAVATVDDFHQRDAQLAIKKPLGDPAPSGESQEVSSVIGVAMNAALRITSMIQMASSGKRLQSEAISRVSITITSIQFNFAAINNSSTVG